MFFRRVSRVAVCLACLITGAAALPAEPMPAGLAGSWRITRILPTTNHACWTPEQARSLLGSTLTYRADLMRWKDGAVPLRDIFTRSVSATDFSKENSGTAGSANFAQLGIHAARVTEINLQHEDADITGSTTEVPGDSVLLAGPNRIVVSACGVYFEATRAELRMQAGR